MDKVVDHKPDTISNDESLIFKGIIQKYNFTHDPAITNEKYEKITEKDLKSRQVHTQGTEDNPKLDKKSQDNTYINDKTKNFKKTIYKIIDQESQKRLSNLDKEIKNLENEVKEKTKNLGKNTEAAGQDFDSRIKDIIKNNEDSNKTFEDEGKKLENQIGNLKSMSFFGKIKNLFSSSGAETNKFKLLLEFAKSPMKILGKVIDVAITGFAVVGAASLLGIIGGAIAAGIGIFYIIYKTANEATEVQINNLQNELNNLTMEHSRKLSESHNNLTSVAKDAVGDIRKNSELIDLQVKLDQKRAEYCTLKTEALQKVVDSQKGDIGELKKEIENANNEKLEIQESLKNRTNDLINNIKNQQNILQNYEQSINDISSANKSITDAHSKIAEEIKSIQDEIKLTKDRLAELTKELSDSSEKIKEGDLNNIKGDIEGILKTSGNIIETATSAMDKIFEKTNNINTALNKISEANQSLEKISKKQEELQEAKLKNNKALAGVLVAMLGKKGTKETMEFLKGLDLKLTKETKLDDLVEKLYGIHNGKTENEKLEENEFISTISIIKSIADKAEKANSKISELISNIEENNRNLGENITNLSEKISNIKDGLSNIKSSNDAIKALSDENGAINNALKASNDIAEKMKDIKIVYIDNGWFSWLGKSLANFFSGISQNMAKAKKTEDKLGIEDQNLINSWEY
jgi:chromosome segregation ATPase